MTSSTFRALLLSLCLLLPLGVQSSAPTPAVEAEIDHLLTYLADSGCAFNRNGTWYDAREARAHLEKKRRYLIDRGLIATTEDFIVRAASESSLSGEPYLVRCSLTAPVASSAWLGAELARYRTAGSTGPH